MPIRMLKTKTPLPWAETVIPCIFLKKGSELRISDCEILRSNVRRPASNPFGSQTTAWAAAFFEDSHAVILLFQQNCSRQAGHT